MLMLLHSHVENVIHPIGCSLPTGCTSIIGGGTPFPPSLTKSSILLIGLVGLITVPPAPKLEPRTLAPVLVESDMDASTSESKLVQLLLVVEESLRAHAPARW